MPNMINDYISSVIADGKSQCTVKAYKGDLKEFAEFVEQEIQKPIEELKPIDLRLWANSLEKRELAANSKARKISSVKSFFAWLYDMECINRDPAASLKSPKIPKKQPKVISVEDAKDLLNFYREEDCDRKTAFRDYTMIAVFLFTGIRRAEIADIMMNDVDLKRGVILIHGKGDKERNVYINDAIRPVLSEYLAVHRDMIKYAAESEYLFPSNKSFKMNVGRVSAIVDKAMDAIGIKERGISVHNLRKRFATTVFNNTEDIATTSKLLGHSSPTVTMRYVDIGEDTKRAAAMAVGF